ncbi:sugar phosphate isomerase/epimerase family protein [Rhodoplanes roseus]|uniref:Xylose isomerase-like TIM barrel domain-containing protein n=1 Tax=Rhodoplanes roseus TaxID=29409 RepID=A0A327L2T4_9BRAD|nr:TIM barrel protein [Rhodoplanes roseus]RAI43802.1 hypothetical protein CH341_12500 [Rhodoplanes roseus]
MRAPGLSINHYLCPPGYGAQRFAAEIAARGAAGIGMTRAALAELGGRGCRQAAADHGLAVTSLNSAGDLLLRDPGLAAAQTDQNRRLIDAAAEMGAAALVIVTGGLSGQGFGDDGALRERVLWAPAVAAALVEDRLAPLVETAAAAGVRLAVEPIHPMDVLFKGAVTSIAAARRLSAGVPGLGLMLDAYHSWWDPDLATPPANVVGLQICGIAQASAAEKPDRDVLGAGIVDLRPIVRDVLAAAPAAVVEFEMFDRHRRGRAVADIVAAAVAAWHAMRLHLHGAEGQADAVR